MNEHARGVDPWSPVDQSATSLEEIKPSTTSKASEPLEVKGGNVTANINLDGKATQADDTPTTGDATEEQGTAEPVKAKPSKSAKSATPAKDQTLAEKLAALDAVKKPSEKPSKK